MDRAALAAAERTSACRAVAREPGTDSRRPDLYRQGRIAAGSPQSTAAAGGLSESRVLQGAGDAAADVRQAADHRLRRRPCTSHRSAARLFGRRAKAFLRPAHRDRHPRRAIRRRASGRAVPGRVAARARDRRPRHAGPRHGRLVGHDRLRQDRDCRLADCPARRQYAGARASPPIAGAMGRAIVGVPRSAAQGDWPHRRRPTGSRPDRWTWPSFKAWCARASSRIAWENTASSSWTSATICPPRASSRWSAGRRRNSSRGSPPPSRARTATIRSFSCSADPCATASTPRRRPPPVPFEHVVLVRPTSFRPLRRGQSGRANPVPGSLPMN